MKAIDQATIVFTSRSANEGFARAAAPASPPSWTPP